MTRWQPADRVGGWCRLACLAVLLAGIGNRVPAARAQVTSEPDALTPAFLLGTWQLENRPSRERWWVDGPDLAGEGYRVGEEGQKQVTEILRLRRNGSSWVYQAQVLDQNNGRAIDFPLVAEDKERWTFANPEHDFPQRLVYIRISADRLQVRVESLDGEGFTLDWSRLASAAPEPLPAPIPFPRNCCRMDHQASTGTLPAACWRGCLRPRWRRGCRGGWRR